MRNLLLPALAGIFLIVTAPICIGSGSIVARVIPTPEPTPVYGDAPGAAFLSGDHAVLTIDDMQFQMAQAPGPDGKGWEICFPDMRVEVQASARVDGDLYYLIDCMGKMGWVPEAVLQPLD